MIVPDLNLLLYAYDASSGRYPLAAKWWESVMNGSEAVGLPWAVLLGFIRLTTSRAVMRRPLSAARACGHVREWLGAPNTTILQPGDGHAAILLPLLEALGTAGNLTTDAHLAALAIEHRAVLHTTDRDFARFAGLKWTNPLA